MISSWRAQPKLSLLPISITGTSPIAKVNAYQHTSITHKHLLLDQNREYFQREQDAYARWNFQSICRTTSSSFSFKIVFHNFTSILSTPGLARTAGYRIHWENLLLLTSYTAQNLPCYIKSTKSHSFWALTHPFSFEARQLQVRSNQICCPNNGNHQKCTAVSMTSL